MPAVNQDWFRLDVNYPRHPKVLAVGIVAEVLTTRAMAHCAEFLTDGVLLITDVPSISQKLKPPQIKAAINQLVAVGLWERLDEGYLIHDYLDRQPSKEEVMGRHQRRAEAGRAGGLARSKGQANASTTDQANAKQMLRPGNKHKTEQYVTETSNPSPTPSLAVHGKTDHIRQRTVEILSAWLEHQKRHTASGAEMNVAERFAVSTDMERLSGPALAAELTRCDEWRAAHSLAPFGKLVLYEDWLVRADRDLADEGVRRPRTEPALEVVV